MSSIIKALLVSGLISVGTWQAESQKKTPLDVNEIYKNPLSHGKICNYFRSEGVSRKLYFKTNLGYGDDIDWIPWETAIETALEVDKPIFLLIHKTWCHACKGLFRGL